MSEISLIDIASADPSLWTPEEPTPELRLPDPAVSSSPKTNPYYRMARSFHRFERLLDNGINLVETQAEKTSEKIDQVEEKKRKKEEEENAIQESVDSWKRVQNIFQYPLALIPGVIGYGSLATNPVTGALLIGSAITTISIRLLSDSGALVGMCKYFSPSKAHALASRIDTGVTLAASIVGVVAGIYAKAGTELVGQFMQALSMISNLGNGVTSIGTQYKRTELSNVQADLELLNAELTTLRQELRRLLNEVISLEETGANLADQANQGIKRMPTI